MFLTKFSKNLFTLLLVSCILNLVSFMGKRKLYFQISNGYYLIFDGSAYYRVQDISPLLDQDFGKFIRAKKHGNDMTIEFEERVLVFRRFRKWRGCEEGLIGINFINNYIDKGIALKKKSF